MATIPFKSGEEIKQAFSAIDIAFNIDNIQSSFELAADDIIDVCSQEVWDKMISHYNSDNYNQPDEANPEYIRLNSLVKRIQSPLAALGIYKHFIWLQLRISNNSITVMKSDDETPAYKYMTDEGKENLLENTWSLISKLVDFLESETANIPEWAASQQRTNWQNQLFRNYKEFNNYFTIDNNAAYFINLLNIIRDVTDDEITPRIPNLSTIEAASLVKVKRAVAQRAVALSLLRFDSYYLPKYMRRNITNSMGTKKQVTEDDIKYKLHERYMRDADRLFDKLDIHLSNINRDTTLTTEYQDYEQSTDTTKKHVSFI